MAAVLAQQPWAKSASFSPSSLVLSNKDLIRIQAYSSTSSSDGKPPRRAIAGTAGLNGSSSISNGSHTRGLRMWPPSPPSLSRGSDLLPAFSWRWDEEEETEDGATSTAPESGEDEGENGEPKRRQSGTFDDGVNLFNEGDYYACHDVLEALWMGAGDPQRGALHGILQCAVGLYHLFNQNHKGAMLEMGEGLTKIRRLRAESGPFREFEESMGAVLEFVYSTQLEHAACIEEYCLTMDGSEESYKLLGNFGAGQPLYQLCKMDTREGDGALRIRFNPRGGEDGAVIAPVEVTLPVLRATSEDLYKRL